MPNCEIKLWSHPKAKKFRKFVKNELSEYGMKLIFGKGQEVNVNGFRTSGYFDEKQIRVAKNCSDWLSVLVHEYSHFLQWKYKASEYDDMKINGMDSLSIIDDWINGVDFRPSTLKKAFIKTRRMEKNCEMLSLMLIRKHELPVSHDKFIRQANCHIYYYHMMEKTRKRSIHNEMFYSRAITKMMPKTFRCKNVRHIPEKIYRMALKTF